MIICMSSIQYSTHLYHTFNYIVGTSRNDHDHDYTYCSIPIIFILFNTYTIRSVPNQLFYIKKKNTKNDIFSNLNRF